MWIVLYGYMKMYEWLLGVEYDVYHGMVYFCPYFDYEKWYEVVELYDLVDVGECVYVNLWWYCW